MDAFEDVLVLSMPVFYPILLRPHASVRAVLLTTFSSSQRLYFTKFF